MILSAVDHRAWNPSKKLPIIAAIFDPRDEGSARILGRNNDS
jgi:hypothetical protein